MPISKGEFAARRGVTPGRVSQWIAAGQISGAAIVGEGRFAQIDEAMACEQLGVKLDVSQRHANGLATNLRPVEPASAAPSVPLSNTLEQQLLGEKLAKAQRENRAAATDEALRLGELCETAEARRATTQQIAQVIARVEGALPEIAAELAAQFKLPQRDVLHGLRGSWRKIRQAAAIEARERAEPLLETTGFEIADG